MPIVISHFKDVSVAVDTTSYRLWQRVSLFKEQHNDRYEYKVTDAGIFLIRTRQKVRLNTELIDAFQTAVNMMQGARESNINVAQLFVLKQILSGRASTVSQLVPLCNHNRVSTKVHSKKLVGRQLLEPDVQLNKGGNTHGTEYAATAAGRALIKTLSC